MSQWNGSWQPGSPSNSSYADMAADVKKQLPANAAGYENRHVTIDHMTIRAAGFGIAVQGAGTVIRDSTIEVDSGTAISIFGPDALIENNTIIVNGSGLWLEADAPIRLHHGDRAVIRNNRIIVRRGAHRRAVSVFETGPFRLENNTFYGIDDGDVVTAFLGKVQLEPGKNVSLPLWRALLAH